MQVYEVPHPNLENKIRYKILDTETINQLHDECGYPDLDAVDFMRFVLSTVILDFQSTVLEELRSKDKDVSRAILRSLFNGSIMLNPGLDFETWVKLSAAAEKPVSDGDKSDKKKIKKVSRTQFLNLERHLREKVIGQDDAIAEVVNALKRSQVGLNDERRPLGVFLFAGASGVGKTHLARELHNYLFGSTSELVRIDCGEYQHKHENSKLLGAPPGYLGYDEGGHLVNQMKKTSGTVVLLDEVEKAHPDIWNTFLRVFDEGILTSGDGKDISFRDSIIIMTTNLGNRTVVEDTLSRGIGFSTVQSWKQDMPKRERVERLATEAVRKNFTPEFLNRLDKTVIFNHLTKDDFQKISELELAEVNSKLSKKGFSLAFDTAVVDAMVSEGMNSVQGARRLSQIRRDKIEDKLADALLAGRFPRGTIFQLTLQDAGYVITAEKRKSKAVTVEAEDA